VFEHYKHQFPYYPTEKLWRWEQYQKLAKSDYISLLEDTLVRQSMAGLALAWSYMPHSFNVSCRGLRTPYEAWSDKQIFKKVLKKVIQMGHPLTMSGIRKILKIYSGTQGVSNFRPTAAACLYHHLGAEGVVVWDMSCGYGGRLLGANLVGVGKYIGTEPCGETFKGLQDLVEDFITIPTELHQCGSEDYIPKPNSLDLCFTSPPYFNTERYSEEASQSCVRFPTQESWRVGFLKKTMENCWGGLKYGGKMVINIADVQPYPNLEADTVRTAEEVGFTLVATWELGLSALPMAGKRYKTEPIFIFEKEMKC
jgi:hypothetical protein